MFRKRMMTLKFFFFFTSPAAGKTGMEIVYLTTFVEGVEIGII